MFSNVINKRNNAVPKLILCIVIICAVIVLAVSLADAIAKSKLDNQTLDEIVNASQIDEVSIDEIYPYLEFVEELYTYHEEKEEYGYQIAAIYIGEWRNAIYDILLSENSDDGAQTALTANVERRSSMIEQLNNEQPNALSSLTVYLEKVNAFVQKDDLMYNGLTEIELVQGFEESVIKYSKIGDLTVILRDTAYNIMIVLACALLVVVLFRRRLASK